jgi:hypothetical protein
MEIAVVKHGAITIGKGIVVILAFLFILTKCGGCDSKPVIAEKHNNDSLFARIKADSLKFAELEKQLVASEAKTKATDSLKVKAEANYASAKKKLREGFKKGICDTVEVEVFIAKCDSVIEANHEVIAQRDTTIKILKEEVKQQADMLDASRTVIKNQDEDYKELEKASKKALRRQKWITRLVIIGDAVKDALLIFALK